MEYSMRAATPQDLECINDIYNHYVLNSTCTYQTEPETLEDRTKWFAAHTKEYPVLVAEDQSGIIGWASLSRFHVRQAYFPTVEDSVYVRHDVQQKGLGSAFLLKLIELGKEAGHHSIMAGISADQTGSIKLHEKYQFQKVAHFKEVGFKFNMLLDVVWYQLLL